LYCDKTGILWIGTDKGVCEYDPLANQVAYHYIRDDKRPDLTNLNIYDFYENDDGSLLLGTDGGLFIRDKNALDFKCKYSGFHNKPLIIYKFFKHSDGKLYLITNSNNFIYDTKRKSLTQIPFFINTPNGFDYSYQNSVKTAVVADTVYNILYSEGKKRSMLISDFRGDKKNLQRDTLGSCSSFWVGSIGWGLYQYHFSQNICGISYHQATPDCLTSNMIQSIIKDNTGKIWIGTNGGGLNAMQFKSFCPGFISFINEPSNPYSLSSNSISDMCSDKNGIFWITTYDGVLNRFNPNAKNKKYFTHITGTGDLSKQSMHSILCDAKNNLWIATASAILKYNTDTNKFFAWKLKEQLPYDQYPGKKYLGKDGTIYFGGNKFYISFHPDSLHINSSIPPVVITSFKIFNQPADDQLLTNEIKLEHNKNFFSFEFASLNFSNPSENKYAHKLDGVDKNWVYTKSKNSAAYTGIGPGKYTFHVKASNNNDVWNEEGISIKVTIIPAWWQTLFFKIAFILAAIALIFFAIRYYFRQKLKAQQLRLEKIKAVENIRSKIAMDIHDEIGSQLTKITLLNQRIKSGFEKKNEIDLSLLNKVTESSKEVISNLGEIIWAVNPKHDNLPSLLAYIRNYISNFCEHTPIHCNIYFPDEIPALAISPDLKHNLFLVIKESLSNILKHAEATEIVIGCHLINKIFCFEITDNGKGMNDLKGREFGNGLLSMRNRMEAINGKFEIKSETNKGTRITLTAELKV
jgi:signal transduction histidine kinase